VADERLTIRGAAARFGVSESAIRKRIDRGTLRHDKGSDGRIYVYVDTVADAVADTSTTPESNALISQLRDEIQYLREENRRKDEIIMQQAITMRSLTPPPEPTEAPSEPREPPETATQEEAEPPRPGGGQGGAQRPWWRRWFG
jgi:hypothetical protein